MHISDAGLELIKRYEGFSAKPYWLGDGRWTIGYGDTLGVTKTTKPWSEPYAASKLRIRIRHDFEPYVNRGHWHLNQNQHDAIVSCIYNLGPGILDSGRSLGNALASRPKAGAAPVAYSRWVARVQSAIREYDMPGSQFHEGLKKRRTEEAKLFAKPVATKRSKLLHELDAIRAEVRMKFKGDWKRTPVRKRRADSIKRWLGSHPKV